MTEYKKNTIQQGQLSRESKKCILNNDSRIIKFHNANDLLESMLQLDILKVQGVASFNFELTKKAHKVGKWSVVQSDVNSDILVIKLTPPSDDSLTKEEIVIGSFKSSTGEFFPVDDLSPDVFNFKQVPEYFKAVPIFDANLFPIWYENRACHESCEFPICLVLDVNELNILHLVFKLYSSLSDPFWFFSARKFRDIQWKISRLEKYSGNNIIKILERIHEKTGLVVFSDSNSFFVNPAITNMIPKEEYIQPHCPVGLKPRIFGITKLIENGIDSVSTLIEKLGLSESVVYDRLKEVELIQMSIRIKKSGNAKNLLILNHHHPLINRTQVLLGDIANEIEILTTKDDKGNLDSTKVKKRQLSRIQRLQVLNTKPWYDFKFK